MKYYAGIGSRDTPIHVQKTLKEIANLLEQEEFILRSGGANGADIAFESGIKNHSNMNIYLPFKEFNNRRHNGTSYIYIEKGNIELDPAYQSLKHHPSKGNMRDAAKAMMMRNYFQLHGLSDQNISSFVICWTRDGANGTTILTDWDSGGSGQCIRLAALKNIPVYNLNDSRYSSMNAIDFVNLVLNNLKCNLNPDVVIKETTKSLF